jgi:RecB family endonuclease NucS
MIPAKIVTLKIKSKSNPKTVKCLSRFLKLMPHIW